MILKNIQSERDLWTHQNLPLQRHSHCIWTVLTDYCLGIFSFYWTVKVKKQTGNKTMVLVWTKPGFGYWGPPLERVFTNLFQFCVFNKGCCTKSESSPFFGKVQLSLFNTGIELQMRICCLLYGKKASENCSSIQWWTNSLFNACFGEGLYYDLGNLEIWDEKGKWHGGRLTAKGCRLESKPWLGPRTQPPTIGACDLFGEVSGRPISVILNVNKLIQLCEYSPGETLPSQWWLASHSAFQYNSS